jgi:hypothetical protein
MDTRQAQFAAEYEKVRLLLCKVVIDRQYSPSARPLSSEHLGA